MRSSHSRLSHISLLLVISVILVFIIILLHLLHSFCLGPIGWDDASESSAWVESSALGKNCSNALQSDPVHVLLTGHGHSVLTVAELELQTDLQQRLVVLHRLRDGHLHLVP